ncbi:MAG: transposase [Bdellovibrionaceae bacterium]|nr:transposase [Pseudobdellovibrionaceae bacterium]
MKQFQFGFLNDFKKSFGGSLLNGKRKSARTLSTRNPIHAVLKTSAHRCFTPGNGTVEKLIRDHASRCEIKLYRISLNWSHVHMIFLIPSRSAYKKFIRTLTSALVSHFSKVTGNNLKNIFDFRPFTRILAWGRDLKRVLDYHDLNDLEGFGYIRRTKKTDGGRSRAGPKRREN